VLLLGFAVGEASAGVCTRGELDRVNRQLHGYVVDYTNNHGADHRLWSPALCQCRDLYVYLPPGFDPAQHYPLLFWFHGIYQDEKSFLDPVVQLFDHAIVCGQLPPMIIVAPDGTITGRPSLMNAGSFYINSKAGRYEDYIIQDVLPFILQHYPILPEREAHILAGASMGGFAAFNLGFKYRDYFKVIIGVFPPLNLRWVDCHCNYRANFDPCCWGWRTQIRPHEVVARFYGLPLRMRRLTDELVGRGPDAIANISRENPIEMLETYDILPGQLDMYIGYGGQDEYNIDAQVESFLCKAQQRGLTVAVGYDPEGRHNKETGIKLFPDIVKWLGPLLAPYFRPIAQPCVVPSVEAP
jgi:hypothetical protein